jgi:hypothetical protein
VHPELERAALQYARSAFGDVGLVAVQPLQSSEDAPTWRLVLITDAGPRTVVAGTDTDGVPVILLDDPA